MISFADQVFTFLFNMPVGISHTFTTADSDIKISTEEKKEKFMDVVKYFIRHDVGNGSNFYIEFSDSYTCIRKALYKGLTREEFLARGGRIYT